MESVQAHSHARVAHLWTVEERASGRWLGAAVALGTVMFDVPTALDAGWLFLRNGKGLGPDDPAFSRRSYAPPFFFESALAFSFGSSLAMAAPPARAPTAPARS